MTKHNPIGQDLPFVSIVLPVFNEEKYIESCLRTLRKIDYPENNYEIITVDNGSTDKSFTISKQYANKALCILDVNVGAVRNYGVKHSTGEILVFLDSDCLVPNNWLRVGTRLLQENMNHVFGGNLKLRKDPYWIEKYWLLENPSKIISQHELLGSCIFIRKEDFISAGKFDESITSGEDTALSKKLKSIGMKVNIDARLGVVHLGNPTTVVEFVKRQIWHSENYARVSRDQLTDKVYLLVLAYLLSLIGFLIFMPYVTSTSLSFLFLLLLIPAIFSTKRILRAQKKQLTLFSITSIYLIDNLYLVGRSLGFIKGLITYR